MHSVDPYTPPVANTTTPLHDHSFDKRFNWLTAFSFIALPLIFGIIGFAGYIALAFLLEVQPTEAEPVLSHGQQAILISLPICTLIGGSIGTALAFLVARQRLASAVLLFAIAIGGWAITRSLWNAQIAQYGRDASETVLYYPPAGYAAVSAVIGLLVSIVSFVGWIKRRAMS